MAKKATKNNFDIKQLLDNSGSYKNLIYGAVTVLILAVIVFLGIRTLSQNQGDINENGAAVEEENASTYEVVEGDTLWSISEKIYGTGFNWQQIAENNNIQDPNNLEAGTTLNIPTITPTPGEEVVAPTEETVDPSVTPEVVMEEGETSQSTTTEYVVVKGDSLWSIAVDQYNDGYKWVDIARANKLINPDLIHAGNRLNLPR